LARINENTRVIAVCMTNQNIRPKDWREFVTTTRNIEAATGFNFLSELSQSIQDVLETRMDEEGTTPAGVDPCQ
jgi:endonuclease G